MPKEVKEIVIFNDGVAHNQTVEGKYAPARREVFCLMADGGWRFLCNTPPDRSAAMCEYWVPEILTFDRDAA